MLDDLTQVEGLGAAGLRGEEIQSLLGFRRKSDGGEGIFSSLDTDV
jgi:hypothetical protein